MGIKKYSSVQLRMGGFFLLWFGRLRRPALQNKDPSYIKDGALMNKLELIERVRSLNSTASVEFLCQFDCIDLQEYLNHLLQVNSADLTACLSTSHS